MKELDLFKAHMASLTIEQRRAMTPEQYEALQQKFNVPPSPFEVGDVVQFRSGGDPFTVADHIGLDRVSLISFAGGRILTCEAPLAVLKKIEKNN